MVVEPKPPKMSITIVFGERGTCRNRLNRFVIGFRALGRQKEWYYLKRVSRKSIGEADDPLHEKK
jgi:hypothetical protein